MVNEAKKQKKKNYVLNNKLVSSWMNELEKTLFQRQKIKSENKKIIALDVGAQGGFNSDEFFSKKYNNFFEPVLVEPIKEEAEKLKRKNKYVINNGLWSSKTKKKNICSWTYIG